MTTVASGAAEASPVEGIRERKKRLTRQLISNTATQMFLARGFDAVKVTDIARQCDVAEKTVYNYFPTKESLLLDREDSMADAIWQALGPDAPVASPVEATVELLASDLAQITESPHAGRDALATLRRFAELLDSTPSLRAAQRDMEVRLVRVAAEALASRARISPDDPEPQIAAHAVLGLWRIQFLALRRYTARDEGTIAGLREYVRTDVQRAAQLIQCGLWAFGASMPGHQSQEQLRAASEAAQRSGRRVASTIRQARTQWRDGQAKRDER